MAKYQVCSFKRAEGDNFEIGLAKVIAFDLCDVEFIIDELGKKVKKSELWLYELYSPRHTSNVSIDTSKY